MGVAFNQFPWGNNPGTAFTGPFILASAFPGVVYNGNGQSAEPLGVYAVTREVSGSLWSVNNADWNGSGWQQVNSALPSSALVLLNSQLQFLTAPANSPTPIVWTIFTISGGPSSRAIVMRLSSAGETPGSTGVDSTTVCRVPYNPLIASPATSVVWTVTDIFFRVEQASSAGADGLKISRYTGTGAFATTNFLNDEAIVLNTGINEQTTEPPLIDNPTVNSGDKLACFYTALSTGATGYGVYCVLTATF